MQKKYLLGFDVGTSESKGSLTDLTGHILATAAVTHAIRSPQPGFAEHDPVNDWLHDFKIVIKELLVKVNGSSEEIAAVGISTIMAAVTMVDENCEPLRNAILYGIDTRCVAQADELNQKIGIQCLEEEYGTACTIEHFGPKILWVREHEPEVFQKTKHITFASGFLVARLTGNYCVDRYSASSALPMINSDTTEWKDETCSMVCPKELLPKIMKSTYSIAGSVTKRAADEVGLAEGTAVICGTTDAGAEAVSVGVVDSADTMLMYGSTAFYIGVTNQKAKNTKAWCSPYTIDGRYACIGGMATTGSLTRWLKDEFAKELVEKERTGGENAYSALFREAENIPAGSDGLIILPYFQGERMPLQDPKAKGVLFGLNLQHTRGHIVHAAFEGIGYGIAQNMDLLREAGISLDCATAVGGGTKSLKWIQIVSDICGITQQIPEVTIGASYGDALMAGLALGTIASPDEIKKLVKIKYVVKPDMKKHVLYQKYRNQFRELYERNKDLMHELW
ncbi:MAG: FGGY-family carbohydrate kinase [Lachnospiraceae bacterium]|nr:FGGY-family carbohydrate kinase [Lachnospiraceae bacterium]